MIYHDDLDFGYADGSVSCSLPDLRYVLALMAGVAVLAAALAISILRRR